MYCGYAKSLYFLDYLDLVILHVFVVKFLLHLLTLFLNLVETLTHYHFFMDCLLNLTAFSLLLFVLGKHFLHSLAGLPLELILLFDTFFNVFKIPQVIGKSELLSYCIFTHRAASRCQTLMVFFWQLSHITLDLSATRATNSEQSDFYPWRYKASLRDSPH